MKEKPIDLNRSNFQLYTQTDIVERADGYIRFRTETEITENGRIYFSTVGELREGNWISQTVSSTKERFLAELDDEPVTDLVPVQQELIPSQTGLIIPESRRAMAYRMLHRYINEPFFQSESDKHEQMMSAPSRTVKEILSAYLGGGEGYAIKTYLAYATAMHKFKNTFLRDEQHPDGKHPLEVTAGDLERYYYHVSKRNLKERYLMDVMKITRATFKIIKKRDPLFDCELLHLKEKFPKLLRLITPLVSDKEPHPCMTESEMALLCEYLDDKKEYRPPKSSVHPFYDAYGIVRLAYAGGLRRAEICDLRWQNFEKTSDGWYVNVKRKGTGGHPVRQDIGKHDGQMAFDTCLARFRFLFNREPKPHEPVLLMPAFAGDPERPMKPETVAYNRIKMLEPIVRGEEVDPLCKLRIKPEIWWRPHMFRGTRGAVLYANGMQIGAVSKWLGHKDVQTTIDYYVPVSERAAIYERAITAEIDNADKPEQKVDIALYSQKNKWRRWKK
jgi:integrase